MQKSDTHRIAWDDCALACPYVSYRVIGRFASYGCEAPETEYKDDG